MKRKINVKNILIILLLSGLFILSMIREWVIIDKIETLTSVNEDLKVQMELRNQHIKDLQSDIDSLNDKNSDLVDENNSLKHELAQ